MQSLKTLAAVAVTCSSLLGSLAHAQIPVTDEASILQQVANQIETIAKWKIQYDQMVTQIENMEREYQALTGGRGLGTILNDPRYREYLPDEWQGVYDAVRNGGYEGLSGRAATIHAENQIFDACAHLQINDQRLACEAQAVKGAQDKAFALDAYDAARDRLNQIDQLMQRINTTEDPKDIAELQGRIAAEQAMIQNEQTKLQMYAMVAEAEDRLQEQRQLELNAQANARRGYAPLQPIQFGND